MDWLRAIVVTLAVSILFALCSPVAGATDSSWVTSWVSSDYRRGDFKLVSGGQAADIFVTPADFKVVQIAARDLASDLQLVTGVRPIVYTAVSNLKGAAVIVGTLGHNEVIDSLVQNGKLDVSQLRGQWETFLITTVPNPFPNVKLGLVIVGSDRRGTAYGVFELSKAIGVSPWYWWADVTPAHHKNLFVRAGTRRAGPPSVKYRGIFLNDEDWGLQPWAAKTFEPEIGDIGPKTYARICELLLRLKANTLWPAMHPSTKAFNLYPQNKLVADDYAIVMGSSHAEPMLRNNVSEWTAKKEDFDYTRNAEGVKRYWEERVEQNGRFENVYTLGMRGIHDSAMQGPKTSTERIKVLEQIFSDQRAMLASYVNADVTKVAQIFCPYKEVLADYRNGLKVPDDVTIVFPDDNFGYIRYFPNEQEQKRSGGFGVYYHASYLGSPLSYLWLDTTPPALIWEEMSKAYDHGMRKFWMLNVGDLKPAEISIDLFMQMGWDITSVNRENLSGFLIHWANKRFGVTHAPQIARVLEQYYRLGFARKPEHLQWNLPNQKPQPSDLTAIDYGDEMQSRIATYDALLAHVDQLYNEIPATHQDAFFELVAYPVRGAALANRRYFALEKAALYAEQGRASSVVWAQRAKDADERLKAETTYFNEKLAGGKWRHMMMMELPKGQWESMRSQAPVPSPALLEMKVPETAGLGVAIEGQREPLHDSEKDDQLPTLSAFTRGQRFIDVFNTGRETASWTAKPSHEWIRLSSFRGSLRDDARIQVSIDWARAPKGVSVSGAVVINGANKSRLVKVTIFNPATPQPNKLTGFVESNGVVSIEAENFVRGTDRQGVGWRLISGLGRTGNSVAIFPTTATSIDPLQITRDAPVLEYQIQLFTPGKVNVICNLIPTHALNVGRGLRYAIGFDDEDPQLVTIGADLQVPSQQWASRVLNAATTGTSTHNVRTAGRHVLKVYMVDPGVVLDKIVIDLGGLRPSYLGPPETKAGR